MADLNTLAPNYRRAQERWPDAPTLAKAYEALAECFSGSGHGLVEHVKSFIESVCRTVLIEYNKTIQNSTPDTTELLVAALDSLGLRNTRGAEKLDKVLSELNKLSNALGEVRNELGPVAHGKDGFVDPVSADHARTFLHVGDAILGVLLNALEGKQPDLRVTREPYEKFPHFNVRIDRAVAIEVRIDEDDDQPVAILSVAGGPLDEAIELRVEPSRLLFEIDRPAYVEVLKATDQATTEAEEAAADADDTGQKEAVPEPVALLTDKTTIEAGPVTKLVPTYSGILDKIKPDLEAFLVNEGVKLSEAGAGAGQLVDSLLATIEQNMGLDWEIRDQLQARLKLACKRIFVRFGYAPQGADMIAKKMVAWLREHASGATTDSSGSSTVGEVD